MDGEKHLMRPVELEAELDAIAESVGGLPRGWVTPCGRYIIRLADDDEPPQRVVH